MQTFRVVAIPKELAEYVRAERVSPGYGHPAHAEVAKGPGPCRLCLHTFRQGAERRVLFTYDCFQGKEELPLPGPVFVHEDGCQRYPEDGGFPDDVRAMTVTLNAYGRGRRLVAQEYVSDGRVEPVVERLFGREDVDYIHVRNTQAGCYAFAIERAGTAAA
jgi:Protein of unknown function (DUF1203)